MGKLVRCISVDGTLTIMAADTTDIVNEAARIHQTSAVTSAAPLRPSKQVKRKKPASAP